VLGCSKAEITLAYPAPSQSKANPPHSVNRAEVLADWAWQLAAAENNVSASSQMFERAVQVAGTIEDRSEKIAAISAIALKLAEVKLNPRSLQLFNRTVQLAKQGDREFKLYYQDQALRDIAIQLARAGFTERALQLTKTIASKFRKAEALNEIAPILAKAGNLKQAKQTLLDALNFARGITGDYAYMSNGSCGNDKYEVLSKIAGNLSLLAQFDTALQVARSVTGCTSGIGESSEEYQAWAYLGILANLANVNQVKQTWNSAKTIQYDFEKIPVWSATGVKFVEMRDFNNALSVAAHIAKEIPTVTEIDSGLALVGFAAKENALRDIAVKLAEVGQFGQALQVAQMIHEFTEAEKAALRENISDSRLNVKAATLGDIAKFLARSQQVEPALQLAQKISNAEVKATTLGEIAKFLARSQQVEPALQLVQSIPNAEAKAEATLALALELQNTGQGSQAETILSQNLQLPPIPATDNESIKRIAAALVIVGRVEQALQIAQSFKNDDDKQSMVADIAAQLAEVGKLERAFQLANTVTNLPGTKRDVLQKIASIYLDLQQPARALPVVKTIEAEDRDEFLARISDSFAKLRQTQQALQVAQTISSKTIKASALANIAALLRSSGAKPVD
jgi:tetratricopeptide (TPR) repeat protein